MSEPYNRLVSKDPVSVGTTATGLLTQAEQSLIGLAGLVIQPADNVYIGGPGVTTTNGILVSGGQTLDLLHFAGPVYAVCASGTVSVRVMIGAA